MRARGLPPLPPWVPGGATRVVLVLYVASMLISGVLVRWSGEAGLTVFGYLVSNTSSVLHGQVWRIFTAGFVQAPSTWGLLLGLLTIYFFTPDLVAKWGARKFAFVMLGTIALGYGLNALADAVFALLPRSSFTETIRPQALVYGGAPAITALVAGWTRENWEREFRFFFFPLKGKHMYALSVVMCALHVFLGDGGTSGNLSLFVGIGIATLAAGNPSYLRTLYLRFRLSGLRRESDAIEGALRRAGAPTKKGKRAGGPDLRVVQGGAEVPKDKRYLN